MSAIAGTEVAAGAPTAIHAAPHPPPHWDAYVARHPRHRAYHFSRWLEIPRLAFGNEPVYLWASSGEILRGVLPLVLKKSGLRSSSLVSLPYVSFGGPLGDDAKVESALLDHAERFAAAHGGVPLEIRDEVAREGRGVRLDKVTMEVALPGSESELSKQIGSNLRRKLRKANEHSPEVRIGGRELVDEFYSVFCVTMRDLGTPVYPRRFFEVVMEQAAEDATLVLVNVNGAVAAGGLLIQHGSRLETPWTVSLHRLFPLLVNVRLHWEMLALGVRRGSSLLDLGRSTIDSGTYQFKRMWGATPKQLYWYNSPAAAQRPGGGSRLARVAVDLWKRMPLPVANLIGPRISARLPW